MNQPASSLEEQIAIVQHRNRQIAGLVYQADLRQVQSLIEETRHLAEAIYASYPRGVVESQILLSRCLTFQANFTEGLTEGEKALKLCQAHHFLDLLPEIFGAISYNALRIGKYLVALRYNFQHQLASIQNQDRIEEGVAYLFRGIIYAAVGAHQEAFPCYEKAVQLFTEIEDWYRLQSALDHYSNALSFERQYERALACSLQAHALDAWNRPNARSVHYFNLGFAYWGLGRYEEAKAALETALQVAQVEETRNPYGEMAACWVLGILHSDLRQWKVASAYLHRALPLAQSQHQPFYEYHIYQAIAQVYRRQRRFAKAIDYLEKYQALRESILDLRNQILLRVVEIEHDLSLSQQAVANAQHHAKELENEVQRRTMDLQASLQREQRLSQDLQHALRQEEELRHLKAALINAISHEFRTPLSVITFTVDILINRFNTLAQEKRDRYYTILREQTIYLSTMLQEIVTINLDQELPFKPCPYTVTALGAHLEQRLGGEATAEHTVCFAFQPSQQRINTDLDLVHAVLRVLLSNAYKFAPAHSTVHVRCTDTATDCLFAIEDAGIGIPPEERGRIFDLFYRCSNVGAHRGLGIGLYLAQKMVRALQGKLWVEAPDHKLGSTFYLALPLAAPL
ncbi:MAG: tetratricopeptide repeat protein [Caldilineaceae bacterium]|nr:tetratricopeptide repeat protein [Caldilineaceae bacterium]